MAQKRKSTKVAKRKSARLKLSKETLKDLGVPGKGPRGGREPLPRSIPIVCCATVNINEITC